MIHYKNNKKHLCYANSSLEFNLNRMVVKRIPEAPTEEASEIQRLFNEPVEHRMRIIEA